MKGDKNHIFRDNWIFRHIFCINNPHWQSGGIIIFLYKFFIVISDKLVGTFLDVLFLLLAVILPGLLEKPRRNKDWVLQKKIHRRICASDIILIKKSHTLNLYLFFLLLVTAVAQFTTKTENSEKATYFLSIIYCYSNGFIVLQILCILS